MGRVVGVRRRGEAQQAHSRLGLGLQARQDVLTLHADGAGFRVDAATGAEYRRRTAVGDAYHHGLALADRGQRAGELGLRAELLRAEGTADEGQAEGGQQAEQRAFQHA
ncbi:hypothetical protein D9M68_663330 [compost metagenome]